MVKRLLFLWVLAGLMAGCAATPPTEERFVVADLFATPGRSLATVAISPTPRDLDQPAETSLPTSTLDPDATAALPTLVFFDLPTQPLGTFAPQQPTLPPPTPTPTNTPTPRPTSTPRPRATDENATPQPSATPECSEAPGSPFATVYQNQTKIRRAIGCTTGNRGARSVTYQPFEHGAMVLIEVDDRIFTITTEAINNDGAQTDDWFAVDAPTDPPPTLPEDPPEGLFAPDDVFKDVWLADGEDLGWATAPAQDMTTAWEVFEQGWMLHGPDESPLWALRRGDSSSGLHLGPLP